MKNTTTGNYKAILAYITFIGLIIAYILNMEEKDKFVSYHIKNMFGLVILLFISITFFKGNFILQYIGQTAWVITFFMWVFSLLMAITGKSKGIPVISDLFQKWFKFLD
ncbi:MAG: hypothetical protein IMY67_04380 [Bacteroidetes bacterium]|nr:hypothetical protein [Bacteroidota bacterium]